jgi:hypothetical protein
MKSEIHCFADTGIRELLCCGSEDRITGTDFDNRLHSLTQFATSR